VNRVVLWADNTRAGPKKNLLPEEVPIDRISSVLGIICVCLPQQDWCFLDFSSFCAFFRSFMLVPLYSRTRLFWIEETGLAQMLIYT
jgi:hypothetical protein